MATPLTPTSLAQRRFARVVLACVIAGFLALIGAAAMAAWAVERNDAHAGWVEHTYTVEQKITALRLIVERLETARRGYLIDPSPVFRRNFAISAEAEPRVIEAIRKATRDNPRQQTVIAGVETVATAHLRLLGRSFALARRPGVDIRAVFAADRARPLTRDLRRLTDTMIAEERRLLAERTAAQRSSARLLYGMLAVCAALILAVAVATVMVIGRYTGDLARSRDEFARLNDELEGRVDTRTSELTRANDEIQRFAYIVSHDLRSPLVNVMGFTGELEASVAPLAALIEAAEREAPEIITADARMAVREDLPEAIRFIRASTQKMDRLINAILRLSREGKRVLAAEAIDVAQITDGIVATLRHRLDEIGAEVTVARPAPALTADRLAIEQMLSNLIENAVKYRHPDRPARIAVDARAAGDRVEIAVADNGRGIDPRDHDRVFDLFRRSGPQDQAGEGIGLAHVRALAYRLGGLVSCRSALGEGATFTLSLPSQPLPPVSGAA